MSTRILTEDVPAGTGFHVFSRTAGGEFLFGEEEKEHFRMLMNQLRAGSADLVLSVESLSHSPVPAGCSGGGGAS